MIAATLVKQADVDGIWPSISSDLINCLAKTPSFFTAADAWVMCRTGEGFLFVMHDEQEVIASSVWRFEQTNFVCMLLAGRRGDEWIAELVNSARAIAAQGGATQLMASGRIGLLRKLRKNIAGVRMTRCTVVVGI